MVGKPTAHDVIKGQRGKARVRSPRTGPDTCFPEVAARRIANHVNNAEGCRRRE